MTTIPSQLPQIVMPARSGTLQALALQSGQMLDAKVLGAAPNGGTQVEIRGQILNLVLPVPVRAGETIRLEVQGSGQQMKLALEAATMPAVPASPAPAAPAPAALPMPMQAAAAPPQAVAPQQAVAQPVIATPLQAGSPTPPQTGSIAIPTVPVQTPGVPVAAQVAPQATAPLYAQSPGTPNPLAVAAAATAIKPPAPAVTTAPGSVRPVLAAAAVGGATSNGLPGSTAPALPAAPMATTPQAALAQMMHDAVPRQGSVVALTTALQAIAGKVVLPEPVVRAAQQVLAGRVAIDTPRFNGAALQAAIKGSGVFQEAALAQGQMPPAQGDMKSALLALRHTLTTWLGQQPPMAAVAQIAPPLKGVVARAKGGDLPAIDVDAPPEEVGKHLLERTESALARTRLHQHASLPDQAVKTADWSMDLPVMIGQHQALMQFQIHRDQQSDSDAVSERGWQMRFAINLPNMGEVGAQVSLRAGTTGVMLWATDPETSAALDREVDLLREALATTSVRLGAVIVRHGEPPAPASAPSGHFVDSRT